MLYFVCIYNVCCFLFIIVMVFSVYSCLYHFLSFSFCPYFFNVACSVLFMACVVCVLFHIDSILQQKLVQDEAGG